MVVRRTTFVLRTTIVLVTSDRPRAIRGNLRSREARGVVYTNTTLPPLSDLYLAIFNASCHQDARRPQDVRRPKNVRRPEMIRHTTKAVPGTTAVVRT